MGKSSGFITILLAFLFLSISPTVTNPVRAEDAQDNTFTLNITENRISLNAKDASFKEILTELEKKTGIKVNIFDDVERKREP